MDQYRWPLCPAQRGRISNLGARLRAFPWLPKRCLTWEGGFQGSKSFWQQTLCFQTRKTPWPFKELNVPANQGGSGDSFPDVLCDRQGQAQLWVSPLPRLTGTVDSS